MKDLAYFNWRMDTWNFLSIFGKFRVQKSVSQGDLIEAHFVKNLISNCTTKIGAVVQIIVLY